MTDETTAFRDAVQADLDPMLKAQRGTAGLTYDEVPTEAVFVALADRTRLALGAPDLTHHRIRVAARVAAQPEPARTAGANLTYAWVERRAEEVAFLVDFHVCEPDRGSGVAGELFDDLLAVARSWGCRRIEFRVGRSNDRALRFFRRRGARSSSSGDADRGPLAFSLVLDDPT